MLVIRASHRVHQIMRQTIEIQKYTTSTYNSRLSHRFVKSGGFNWNVMQIKSTKEFSLTEIDFVGGGQNDYSYSLLVLSSYWTIEISFHKISTRVIEYFPHTTRKMHAVGKLTDSRLNVCQFERLMVKPIYRYLEHERTPTPFCTFLTPFY